MIFFTFCHLGRSGSHAVQVLERMRSNLVVAVNGLEFLDYKFMIAGDGEHTMERQ